MHGAPPLALRVSYLDAPSDSDAVATIVSIVTGDARPSSFGGVGSVGSGVRATSAVAWAAYVGVGGGGGGTWHLNFQDFFSPGRTISSSLGALAHVSRHGHGSTTGAATTALGSTPASSRARPTGQRAAQPPTG